MKKSNTKTFLTSLTIMFGLTLAHLNAEPATKYANDWRSPEAIVDALYQTISAGPGEQRDWDRFRELFFDNAEMLMSIETPGFSGILASDIDTIVIQTEQAYGKTGFYELELNKQIELYGNMASVYSSFEVKYKASDKQPLMKGLNHFQLLFDGDRWWIISNISTIDNKQNKVSEMLKQG